MNHKKHIIKIQHHAKKIHFAIKHDLKTLTPLRVLEGLIVLLVLLQLIIVGINTLSTNKPVLGARFEGQVVGRLYGEDFRKQTEAIIHEYENKSLSIVAANDTSTVTLRQLGVTVDKDHVNAALLGIGRTGNFFARIADQNMAVLGGRNVALKNPNFNTELAKAYIATLDQEIDVLPANAYFAYENQAVMIHADTPGRVIDNEAAIEALRNANPLHTAQIALPIKQTTATITASLLSSLLPQVQAIAQKPLTITAGSSQTVLSPEQLVSLIVPKVITDPNDANKTTAEVAFDETKLNAIVDEVLKRAVVAPQPTIMNGSQVVQQGKEGIRAEDSHAVARVLAVLIQRQTGVAVPDEAQIPLVKVNPPVVQQIINNPRTRTGTGLVRLTFDDGPGAYTEQVLDILKRYNVHATFYVIGRNVQGHPGTMQRIRNEGHSIGNHSFTHADLTRLSRAGVQQELASTQAAIQAACGITPTGFRPPYGAQNQTVREVAASMGMSVDMWSVDTRDWARPGSSVITQRVLAGTGPGAVVLLHVLNEQTVSALPSIIEGVRRQGFTLE